MSPPIQQSSKISYLFCYSFLETPQRLGGMCWLFCNHFTPWLMQPTCRSSHSFLWRVIKECFGVKSDYGEIKSTELAIVCEDLQELSNGKIRNWRTEVTFWIDKTCIPQRHSLTQKCIDRIEMFLKRCEKMVQSYYEPYRCLAVCLCFPLIILHIRPGRSIELAIL